MTIEVSKYEIQLIRAALLMEKSMVINLPEELRPWRNSEIGWVEDVSNLIDRLEHLL